MAAPRLTAVLRSLASGAAPVAEETRAMQREQALRELDAAARGGAA